MVSAEEQVQIEAELAKRLLRARAISLHRLAKRTKEEVILMRESIGAAVQR